jgi:hypothetical protein
MWKPLSEDIFAPLPDRGYPVDFLISRLKGRSGRLLTSWKSQPEYGGPAWRPGFTRSDLGRELRWIYASMNMELRGLFRPFFFLREMGTIFVCLRFRTREGMEKPVRDALEESLLSAPIKTALFSGDSLPVILDKIEEHISFFHSGAPLRQVLDRGGLAAVEETLLDSFHVFASGTNVHKLLREYFSWLVDMRNILTAFKFVRWRINKTFTCLKGGTIPERSFHKAVMDGRSGVIRDMAADFAGGAFGHDTDLAVLLLRGLIGKLKRSARTAPDNSYILWYLQTITMEARNAETIVLAGGMKEIAVEEELVL